MGECSITPMLVISAFLLFLQNLDCKVIGDYRNEKEISFFLEGGSTVRSRNVDKGYQRLGDYETKSQTVEDTIEKHQIKQQVYSFQKKKNSDAHSQTDTTTTRSDIYKSRKTTERHQLQTTMKIRKLLPTTARRRVQDPSLLSHTEGNADDRSQTDTTTTRSESYKIRNKTERHQLQTTRTIRKLLPTTTRRLVQDPSLRSRREENADDRSRIGDDPYVQTIQSVHEKDDKKLSNYEWGFNSTDVLPGPFGVFFKFKADTNQGQPWGNPSMSWYPPQIGPQQWNFPQQWWSYGQSQGAIPGQGNTGLYQGMGEFN